MRLVDLLLTPRQTTSLPSYGGQAREAPIWTAQMPHSRRSPVYAATAHQKADNSSLKTNPRYYNPHDSPPVSRQMGQRSSSSSGSVDALSELLRSSRSPTFSGNGNRSTVTSNSQFMTTELSRLLQQQDSNQSETLAPITDGSHPQCRKISESSGENRAELVTLDKNLNCTIWKNGGFRVNSSSSFASSASSSSSLSSVGEANRVSVGRRISLLSSDGSELDSPDYILSTMADSDSHESLSSPLKEMEASRWMDQVTSAGYGDWQGLDDGQERESYDVFDTYPLFNFNILGNTVDSADSPFTPLDESCLLATDVNVAFDDDSFVAMVPGVTATSVASEPGSMLDAGLKQVSYGCHDYNPNGMNDFGGQMVNAQLPLSNGTKRHQSSSSSSSSRIYEDTAFVAPVYACPVVSVASENETRSTTSPPQSEVVKLLLQNRHQWAPPAEKMPPHGYHGSRKRAQGSSGRETTRAKASRSSRSGVPIPSERRHSAPSLIRKASPFVSNSSPHFDDDPSSSLERLITELFLLESENDYSGNPPDPNACLDRSVWASVSAAAKQERDVENSTSTADDLFEGLMVCPTKDSELFSSLELESIYSGDCTGLLSLQDTQRYQEDLEGFNVVIKSEPEKAESPSFTQSVWRPEGGFSFPGNRFSRGTAAFGTQYEQVQNGIDRKLDAEATILEGVLQSKLFLDSPPKLFLDSPPVYTESANECKTRNDLAIFDHDYCQTDALPSSGCIQYSSLEPALVSKRRKHSECCLGRGASDYGALKSLLLDSNLTEEVRKEAELDRAKSRRNMSERRTSPVISNPLRASTYGKGVCDEDILLNQLKGGDGALRLLYKSLTALNDGQLSVKLVSEQLLNSDETSKSENENGDLHTDTSDRLSTVSEFPDLCLISESTADVGLQREESNDGAVELSPPLTSDLDLCGGNDSEKVIFFDSFEEYYSSNKNLKSTVEPRVEDYAESISQPKQPPEVTLSESAALPMNVTYRWNSKKPRHFYQPLMKRTSRLLARRNSSRTRAMKTQRSSQSVTTVGRCLTNFKRKPVFTEKRSKSRLNACKVSC